MHTLQNQVKSKVRIKAEAKIKLSFQKNTASELQPAQSR